MSVLNQQATPEAPTRDSRPGNGLRASRAPQRGRQTAAVNQLLPAPLLFSVIAVLLAIVAIPLLYIVFASMNSDNEVARGAFFPTEFTLGNYASIWNTVPLGRGLGNSVLIAGTVAVVSSLLGVITAYVLVRFEFRGRLSILRGLLGLQSIPGTLLLLPVFVLFASAGSYLGITVIGTCPSLALIRISMGFMAMGGVLTK